MYGRGRSGRETRRGKQCGGVQEGTHRTQGGLPTQTSVDGGPKISTWVGVSVHDSRVGTRVDPTLGPCGATRVLGPASSSWCRLFLVTADREEDVYTRLNLLRTPSEPTHATVSGAGEEWCRS